MLKDVLGNHPQIKVIDYMLACPFQEQTNTIRKEVLFFLYRNHYFNKRHTPCCKCM